MATNKIKYVEVIRLWGVKDIRVNFYDDVNIFIGANGSSKTTFLNLIEAVLQCEIKTFISIDFEYIKIVFDSFGIKVYKDNSDEISRVRYTFDDGSEYSLPCVDAFARPYRYVPSHHREVLTTLKERLANSIKISWLSVNRAVLDEGRGRDYLDRFNNLIDYKLIELVNNLVVYQLQLESESNRSANNFKEKVLALMLYDDSIDRLNPANMSKIANTDIDLMKNDLIMAFNAFGVREEKKGKIQIHVDKIKDVISRIQINKTLSTEDVMVLSLINRTLSIIDISKEHEKETKDIFSPMERFWECLNRFMNNKSFELEKENNGEVRIKLKESNSENVSIGVTSLSSGEKQLFILLTEALLQKGVSHLFLADEPELSLHIEWQRKVLHSILEINPNAQIVVATHSPEIAGNYPKRIINMRNITYYE